LLRDSHLDKVPGFVKFHLLKGPEAEDHTLYASQTVRKSRATFEAWTKSEAFERWGGYADFAVMIWYFAILVQVLRRRDSPHDLIARTAVVETIAGRTW
jgi:hypothetical protein